MKRAELVGDIDELKGTQGRARSAPAGLHCRTRPTSTPCCGRPPAASATRSTATRRRSRPTSRTATSRRKPRARSTAWCSNSTGADGEGKSREAPAAPDRRHRAFRAGEEARRQGAPARHREPRGARRHAGAARSAPTDLGPLRENYKDRCARSDHAIQASNPAGRRPAPLHRSPAPVPPVLLPGLRRADRERDRGGRGSAAGRRAALLRESLNSLPAKAGASSRGSPRRGSPGRAPRPCAPAGSRP